jgi:hypothetical protein
LVFKPSLTPNLVVGMKWLLSTYTSCFNRHHKFFGHLFSGRYKSLIVDGSGSGYLKKRGRLRPFESGASETGGGGCALEEFCLEQLLGEWGMPEDSPEGRQRLEQALEERRGAEEGEEFKPIRRGWCLGEEKFREELLTQVSEPMGAEHYGEERAETAEAHAELIIAEELKLGRWQEADLKTRPKGDSVKVALAARLRAETTMTVGWIAERLAMGTRGYLNHLLYRRRKLGRE